MRWYAYTQVQQTQPVGVACCSQLHEHFLTTPKPIKLYIKEVKKQLQVLTNYHGPAMALKDKESFIRLTRHAFGRTALVLSGGGALGAFHLVSAAFASAHVSAWASALTFTLRSPLALAIGFRLCRCLWPLPFALSLCLCLGCCTSGYTLLSGTHSTGSCDDTSIACTLH